MRALLIGVALMLAGCAPASPSPVESIIIMPIGPVQAPPPRPFADLAADTALATAVEATVREVDAMQWHRGEIDYPYSLAHLTVSRQWKQPQPDDLAVRVFGGREGNRKFVSAIQPDPATLVPGTRVLLFISMVSEIDPGVRAATIEEFFFIEGDRLLRFDRTPADVTLAEAVATLDGMRRIP